MRLRPPLSALFIFLSAGVLCAQTATPHPTDATKSDATNEANGPIVFRTTARTVIVDVVVTGHNGLPVHGLHQQDFVAAEDGHPQKVTFFEEHVGAHAMPATLPPLPPHVFSNVPRVAPTDSLTVLLLDSLNTPMADQGAVHKQTLKYLENLQPGRRFAIFSLARRLRLVQGFTDDPSLLAAALRSPTRGRGGPQSSPLLNSYAEENAMRHAIEDLSSLGEGGGGAPGIAALYAEQKKTQDDDRALITLDAFQQLARYLSGIPGRKNVVWFSGAFPVLVFSAPRQGDSFDFQRSYGDAVRKTDALLASAEVALYPVSAEGVAVDFLYDTQHDLVGVHGGAAAQMQSSSSLKDDDTKRNENQATMDEIARATGGEAIYNSNDFNDALGRAAEHGSSYYTLYYTPSNTAADSEYRQIQIKLEQGKYKLAYRRGYYAADAKTEKASTATPASDPLFHSMVPGLPASTQIPFALRVLPGAPAAQAIKQPATHAGDNQKLNGPLTRYSVDFVIAANGLQLDPASDGGRLGKIEIALVIYNQEGKPVNWMERQVDLTMDAARFAQVQANGISLTFEIDAPKDAATLRSGVYDWRSSMTGSFEIPLSSVSDATSSAHLSPPVAK